MVSDRLLDDVTATRRFAELWRDPGKPPWDVRRCPVEREKIALLARYAAGAQRVLDVGCGGGDFLARLCRHTGRRFPYAAGLDVARGALERAARSKLYDRLECGLLSDAEKIFEGDLFDLVLASDVLYYIAGYRTALTAIVRSLLAPAGKIFISVGVGARYFSARDCATIENVASTHDLELLCGRRIDYRILGWPRARIPLSRVLWPQTHKQIWVYRRR